MSENPIKFQFAERPVEIAVSEIDETTYWRDTTTHQLLELVAFEALSSRWDRCFGFRYHGDNEFETPRHCWLPEEVSP